MKIKTVLELLGWRQPTREYGCERHTFTIDGQVVHYAQWLHPKESLKRLQQSHVDQMRAYLGPGDVAIDIGAHTGDSTLPLALAVGSSGTVLAMEPNPYVFRVLEENARLNPATTNIVPLCCAATAEDGPIEFEYSDPGFCNGGRHEGISKWKHGHAYKLTVLGRNLERLLRTEYAHLLPRLRFLKVDAEGYDGKILASIRALVCEFQPVIKAEFYKHAPEATRLELWDLLDACGYWVQRIEDECDRAPQRVSRGQVTQWQHFDVLCVPKNQAARRAA